MYDPIFSKSFSRYERRKFGCCALILSSVIALCICSTSKPNMHPLSLIGDTVNLKLSIDTVEDMLVIDDEINDRDNSKLITVGSVTNRSISTSATQKLFVVNETINTISQPIVGSVANEPMSTSATQDKLVVNETNTISPEIEIQTKEIEPLCRILEANADYCEMEGDIRVDANSLTVYLVKPRSIIESQPSIATSWIIQPYPRKGILYVKNWTVTLVSNDDKRVPECSRTHNHPAVLFSIGGFSGNHFHDFADILVPLFSTSFHFKKQVHFLASDYKPWWHSKFRPLLDKLTSHKLVDIDKETQVVNCYNKMTAGVKFYSELVIKNSSSSSTITMQNFRQFLRKTYSLERTKSIKRKKGPQTTRPRIMIVSRKGTRILTNEAEISRVAKKLGYEVVVAEPEISANLTAFAQVVNSCDVLMGVHGAGLTNMVFLPDNAILIQVVPLGGIDGFAKLDFGNPASGMNIRYVEYKIKIEESSLFRQYPIDHPVLRDPLSFHRNGWGQLRSIYLDNQNVTIDARRFRGTLVKALKLLQH
ncbi:hypothetical protein ABFS83_09G052900 [Erythranthe nasuta]